MDTSDLCQNPKGIIHLTEGIEYLKSNIDYYEKPQKEMRHQRVTFIYPSKDIQKLDRLVMSYHVLMQNVSLHHPPLKCGDYYHELYFCDGQIENGITYATLGPLINYKPITHIRFRYGSTIKLDSITPSDSVMGGLEMGFYIGACSFRLFTHKTPLLSTLSENEQGLTRKSYYGNHVRRPTINKNGKNRSA